MLIINGDQKRIVAPTLKVRPGATCISSGLTLATEDVSGELA
jgi:hypothetical protein